MAGSGDPADVAVTRDTVRLAFVAALQHLPPRQRAALILCEVLQWKASEVAGLLETTPASVNSALQRARATLGASRPTATAAGPDLAESDRLLLARYVAAFEAYDIEALTALIHEDATQSMPPFDMWLAGRDDIFAWWLGPGIGCRGSRVIPVGTANGSPAFGQYKPARVAATSRGRCRCSSCGTAGSASSPSSSLPGPCSPCSACRPPRRLASAPSASTGTGASPSRRSRPEQERRNPERHRPQARHEPGGATSPTFHGFGDHKPGQSSGDHDPYP